MTIPQRPLTSDGPPVGAVGLGCMGMSWGYSPSEMDDARSIRTIHRALDVGVTLLDTADAYGPFANEELIARALADRRAEAFVATKVGIVVHAKHPPDLGLDARPARIRTAIDDSLFRLGTDHVDLYQLHRVDPQVPLEESWGALAEAVDAGKALRIGLSEVTVEQLEIAHAIHPVASVQSELSLFTRDPLENGVLAWCMEHGAGFLAYAPLGRGMLTATVTREGIEDGDYRAVHPRFAPDAFDHNRAIVDTVVEIAAAHEATPGQVALAWTLAQGERVVPIPGTKREARVEENAGAASLALSPEDLARLDALPAAVGGRSGAFAQAPKG